VRTQLSDIGRLIEIKKSSDVNSVVTVARDTFNANYDHSIRDLLCLFPPNQTDSSGNPFWSGPKRCPAPVEFSANDEVHLNFVWTCANLIFTNLGMPALDKAQI